MSNTLRLFAAAKRAAGLTTDYQLAKQLGLTTARMSTYKRGVELQEDDVILRAAKLAGWNPLETLAEFQGFRAKTDVARSSWAEIAKLARIHGRAAAIFVAYLAGALASLIVPGEVSAKALSPMDRVPSAQELRVSFELSHVEPKYTMVTFLGVVAGVLKSAVARLVRWQENLVRRLVPSL